MIAKKFLLCLSVVLFAACQSQAPSEKPSVDPEAPSAESPKAAPPAAPAKPVGETPADDEIDTPIPGEPSEFAGKVVPAGVDWFGAVDLRALKGTVLERQFRPWLRYLDSKPEYVRVMEEIGAGDLQEHTLIVGGAFTPQTALGFELFGAVFGLKEEAKMSAWIAGRIAEKGAPAWLALKTGHKDGVAAWAGGPSLYAKVEALLAGEGESVNDDDAWVELQRSINTKAPLWALVRIPELLRAQFPLLHREIPGLQFFPGVMEILGMTHAAMSLDIGDRLEVRIALKLESAEDAQVVREQLWMLAEANLWDPSFFFDVFQLQATGSLVTLNAATSKKIWRISVFWLSVAAQTFAYEEMHVRRWNAEELNEEEALKTAEEEEALKIEKRATVKEQIKAHSPSNPE